MSQKLMDGDFISARIVRNELRELVFNFELAALFEQEYGSRRERFRNGSDVEACSVGVTRAELVVGHSIAAVHERPAVAHHENAATEVLASDQRLNVSINLRGERLRPRFAGGSGKKACGQKSYNCKKKLPHRRVKILLVTQRFDGIEARGFAGDRKSTRLNSSHIPLSRMPSS